MLPVYKPNGFIDYFIPIILAPFFWFFIDVVFCPSWGTKDRSSLC